MKRQRKKYLKPSHPWEKERIDAEDKIIRQYGLLRKEEIWRTQTSLRNFRRHARHLLAVSGTKAEMEVKQLLDRLRKLGLIDEGATLDDVLDLSVEKLLERRLQTLVFRKGIARTPRQARQLVLHGHITIEGRKVNAPSYLVPITEEGSIALEEGFPVQTQMKPPEAPEPIKGEETEIGKEEKTEERPSEEVE